jgi:hypothetical protein
MPHGILTDHRCLLHGVCYRDAAELEEAGADRVVMSCASLGLAMGREILTNLGASMSEAAQV